MAASRFQRRRTPSFSSSLLDAIYRSIDDEAFPGEKLRNDSVPVEQEIESLRRAIRVEKWMGSYMSASSTDSSNSTKFSPSETDSSSTSYRPLPQKLKNSSGATPRGEGHLTRTNSRAHNEIYGDLKKVKQPLSPGARIANFFNSIFTSRKSRTTTTQHPPTTASSGSSLSKTSNSSANINIRRPVRFCPVTVVADEYHHHKKIDGFDVTASLGGAGRMFVKKKMDCFGLSLRDHKLGELYGHESDTEEKSCCSSDLFELDVVNHVNRGIVDELPVYGTTSLGMNRATANGCSI